VSFHVKLSNLQWSSSSSTFNQILSFKFPINNEGTISWAHIAGILNFESWIIDFEYAFPYWCYLGILIFLILHIEQKYFNIEPLKFRIPTFSEVLIVISSSGYWGCSCFNILTTAANIKTSAIIKKLQQYGVIWDHLEFLWLCPLTDLKVWVTDHRCHTFAFFSSHLL